MGNTTFRGVLRSTEGLKHVSIADATGVETETEIVNSSGVLVAAPVSTEPIKYTTETGITAFATGGQGSATALTEEFNNVTTCATAGDSVALPTAVVGLAITVKNSGAASLAVFPATGDSINALAVNLSVNVPVGGTLEFRAISATVWETNEALVLSAPTTQPGELVIKAADNAADHEVIVTNASHGQATTHTLPDPGGATGTIMLLEGTQTVAGAKTFSGGLVGDVNGTAMAVTEGSGVAGAAAISSEITKLGKIITTHIFIDIAGLLVSTTLNDIIGDDDAANAHFGQVQLSESGQIVSGTVTCLEVPTTGVDDIDFNASSASTGAEDADVTALADYIALLSKGGSWALNDVTALTDLPDATSDYLYLSAGAAGTPGTYDAGQFLIELIGYEA
jgi:hypothetical protein